MNDDDRATCAALAALLGASAAIQGWGLMLSGIAALALALVFTLPITASACVGAVLLLGLGERYLAFRLRLDQRLFADLSRGPIASPAALDAALQRLHLRKAPPGGRALDARARGTRRLLQCHALVVAGQSAAFALALFIRHSN